MSANKFRLVTRADFDGAVSGCLLMELEMIGEVKFAEPKQVQDGEIKIDSNDILTNLPYAENAHLCIDHHLSEVERVGARDNLVIDPEAPSAARVVGVTDKRQGVGERRHDVPADHLAAWLLPLEGNRFGGPEPSFVGLPDIRRDISREQRAIDETFGKADRGGKAVFDVVVGVFQEEIQKPEFGKGDQDQAPAKGNQFEKAAVKEMN
jgi:hypothetical protein